MFYALLLVTFLISMAVSGIVVAIFSNPANRIFQRIIQDEIASAWTTYLKFALFVVGISSGVRIEEISRYIIKPEFGQNTAVEELTTPKWVLEIYRTIIDALDGLAGVLLCFFIVSLLAFVVIKIGEMRRARDSKTSS